MRVTKIQNFHLCVSYPFKRDTKQQRQKRKGTDKSKYKHKELGSCLSNPNPFFLVFLSNSSPTSSDFFFSFSFPLLFIFSFFLLLAFFFLSFLFSSLSPAPCLEEPLAGVSRPELCSDPSSVFTTSKHKYEYTVWVKSN